MYRTAAFGTCFLTCGAPVLLAPAVTELFGRSDATAIYQRLAACVVIASPVGATLVTSVRDRSYLRHATELAATVDEARFVETFGASAEQV
jgi:hypothetical protein